MTSDVEPAKKVLLPYLQRADELQKHEPLVAYYCRLYGMERGLKIPVKERTKTTNAILVSLMNQLEKDKKSVKVSPDDNMYVEGFALNVFAKADKQDRAGRADLNTAKTFYAASIFIEILHQFGPLQPDIEQKQKYAVWKAADIRKALSEGRKPVPGPPGGDEELSSSPSGSMDSVVTPNNAAAEELEGRSFERQASNPAIVRQASNPAFGMVNPNLDGGSKMTNFRASQPDQHDYYGSATDPGMPQQPPFRASQPDQHDYYGSATDPGMPLQPPFDFAHSGHTQSGYTSPYPGTYHPSVPADRAAPSSSMAASPHGSMPQLDAYSSLPHTGQYSEYLQTATSAPMYSSVPTTYMGNNGVSNAVHYQPQDHAPSAVTYPATAPFSADYNSFVGSNDSSGSGRTSVSASPIKVHNYQPTPEKITEAQKAARFAVSALAFDDIPTAVAYLKQSLELLTNPPI